ncbi:molybdopterin-dependent oxidoreductase [Hydrogenophaga sp. 5NK40-0174]|uniref:nitrate reductase n=1 Tax=Hydrogenophaga sp. 5NK40-0174 TaxID=3127649 RepID=UPI00310419D6
MSKTTTRSTCPYCGVGCGVLIESDGQQITGVRGDPDHPANFGKLCTKGSTLHLTAAQPITLQTRLLQPMQRAQRGAAPQAIEWDEAIALAANRLADVVTRHGPDAVGLYLSGQLLTEDYYVFNKLAKGLIGTNNVDTNSRLCMSSAVAGYKATLGADAPPACYDDVNHADCLFIVGSNTAFAHPILFRRIEDAKRKNPDMKVIVADPRRTDTAGLADLYLPVQPGSDVALFHGMLHLMLWEGWVDQAYIDAHTEGFSELKALVREYTPAHVAEICGISTEQLQQATQWFATSGATLSLYCQGLNQSSSGTAKNASLINLHLATGQIGKPGAGPFSLTGQPNAMGGREVGGLANLLSAHRDMANPAHRAEVAALWGVPSVPEKPGKTAVDMFQAAADGEIKALWIVCTNPAQSLPDQATVRRALERAEFVIVQEAFSTAATCDYADLLLPAATWGEKEGTVTNSERRISRTLAAVPPAGEARSDWRIAVDVAQSLQRRIHPELTDLFPYQDTESIWLEHRESTRGRDLDITGLSFDILEKQGPQQWPMPEGASQGKDRLYADGVFPTASGKARFNATPWKPVAERREARYPFSLTTGRLRDQWHGMTRTGTLGRLFGHVPEPVVELNAHDMERRGIAEGDLVELASQRGTLVLPAQASDAIQASQAFVAMHWGSEYLSGRDIDGKAIGGINALTTPAYCPTSKQPELKHTAIRVSRAKLPWRLLAMAWLPASRAHAVLSELRSLMPSFDHAACVPFGRERTGVLLRAAATAPVDDAVLERIEELLGLDAADALRYADKRQHQRRSAHFTPDGEEVQLRAVMLAGDASSEAWIKNLIKDELPARQYGRLVLMPGGTPPVALATKGKEVCTCFGVSEDAIVDELQEAQGTPEERLAKVQKKLSCGTNCGSCLPELRKIIAIHPASQTA